MTEKPATTSRFDYVKYDELSEHSQRLFKRVYTSLEEMLETLPAGPHKDKAVAKLEESYMWVGKALRDEQIARNGYYELQEGRKNG